MEWEKDATFYSDFLILMSLLIPNPSHLQKILERIRFDGDDNLHILADFDRTLTYGSQNGMKTTTIVSLLRDGKHLREDYAKRAHQLYDIYNPIEIDSSLSIEEKKPLMTEWWNKHFELMIECGLKMSDIEDVLVKSHLQFRTWVRIFLQRCYETHVPVIIISASACGEAIPIFFQKHEMDFSNISYVCNQFEWRSDGTACAVREPIIHVFNKDETILETLPEVFDKIHNRKNIILLWDSLWDIGMSTGFDYTNLLKIGFLNISDTIMREQFAKNFDIIVEWDNDFSELNTYLQPLLH